MYKQILLLLITSALFLVACSSGSNDIGRVTALPDVTSTPTLIMTVPVPTNTPSVSATPVAPADLSVPGEATDEAEVSVSPNSSGAGQTRSTGSNNFALMTFTPAPNRLGPGEARSIALATDQYMQPDIEQEQRIAFEENPVPIQFSEFYDGFSIRTGLQFSDMLKSLDGERVVMEGYIAPPLKPRLDFFVLTRIQLAFCPFCSTDVEWPDDIALVYMPEQRVLSSERPVRITGTLELGSSVDAETGMVSLVRIYMDEMEVLN